MWHCSRTYRLSTIVPVLRISGRCPTLWPWFGYYSDQYDISELHVAETKNWIVTESPGNTTHIVAAVIEALSTLISSKVSEVRA
jgi:hypothetical protein